MPILEAPNKIVFLVSLILFILAWVSAFVGIGRPSILLTLAYIVLAVGCF